MIDREELERLHEAAKPWANFHGDLPDYDHPLRCVYESGIQYAVELLATILKVDDYEVCDGTEEFDGDLGGTLFNIVLAAMPKDDHGDPIHPSELRATLAAENAALTEKVERLEEALRLGQDHVCMAYCHFDDITLEATRHQPVCDKLRAALKARASMEKTDG